ncbi:MAG: hypothetical protein KGL39_15550 [Patescibacteria group bacterium]|nr:hypothetical protein [Patescibacteria group bacterium]
MRSTRRNGRTCAKKKLWEKLIWIAKVQARIYHQPKFERSKIHILRRGKKLLDKDNLVGGVKPLVDSLKALGVIVDDSPAHISLTIEQCLGKPCTVILIEKIDAPATTQLTGDEGQ